MLPEVALSPSSQPIQANSVRTVVAHRAAVSKVGVPKAGPSKRGTSSWGFRRRLAQCPLDHVPVDFLSDPDGPCDYAILADAAGFDPEGEKLRIGALVAEFEGFREGSAVVVGSTEAGPHIILLEVRRRGVLARGRLRTSPIRLPACSSEPLATGPQGDPLAPREAVHARVACCE